MLLNALAEPVEECSRRVDEVQGERGSKVEKP